MAGLYIPPVDPNARHSILSNASLNSRNSMLSAMSSDSHHKLDKNDLEYLEAVQIYGIQGENGRDMNGDSCVPYASLGGNPLNPLLTEAEKTTSLYLVMFYTFLMTVSYIIILPTSKAYVTNLGGNEDLVGLAIGLTPCLSGLCQLPIMYILRKVSIRTLLLYFSAWLAAMQIVYAMAGWMNSLTVLLASRALMGLGDGPQLVTLYVVRSTTPKDRSAVMLLVGVSIAAGYSAGCLLSTVITEAKRGVPMAAAGDVLALANAASIAGWFIAAMAIMEWILVFQYFKEPRKHAMGALRPVMVPSANQAGTPAGVAAIEEGARESRETSVTGRSREPSVSRSREPSYDVTCRSREPSVSGSTHASISGIDESMLSSPMLPPSSNPTQPLIENGGMEEEPEYPWGQLVLAYAMCFLIPVQISAWEVMIAVEAEDLWGWSASDTGLYLFLILTIAIPVYKIKLSLIMSDRSGVLSFVLAGILGSLLFLEQERKPESLGISCFTIGSVVFLISMQIARGFAWGLLTNLVPLGQRPILVGINAMLYMLGRGVGAVVPPYMSGIEMYVAVFTGAMSICWLTFFWAYKAEFFPKKRNMRKDLDIDDGGGH